MSGSPSRRLPALLTLCVAEFMLVLDDTIVNVALPTVRDELGFATSGLAWVVNAYFLAFGGLLLTCGRMADRFGRRRLFVAGVLVFGAASLACGFAQQPWQLVVGRFVQGTGAALASPAALALLTVLYPGSGERARAFAIWGSIGAIGGTSGLVISGVLTGFVSWRWVFFVNVPLAVLAVAVIPLLVGESRSSRAIRVDVPGTVLGTCAPLLLVYGLLNAASSGWGVPASYVPLAAASLLAAAFVVVESRVREPLVPASFLASRTRSVALLVSLPFVAAFFSLSFLLMLRLQTALGFDPFTAGLAFLPYGAGILAGIALSARMAVRLGQRSTLLTAFLVSAAGLLLLSVSTGESYLLHVLPGMLVASVGSGLGFPTLTVAAVSGATNDDSGLASATVKAVQQLGGAVGLALLVTVATDGTSGGAASTAFAVAAAALGLCALLVAVLLPKARPVSGTGARGSRRAGSACTGAAERP